MVERTTTSPTQPKTERRHQGKHEAILQAASELLAEQGYGKTTIEGIAARAGVGKQTIYRWWPTKLQLFIEIYHRDGTAVFPAPDLGSVEQELIAKTRQLWTFWRDTPSGQTFRSIIAEIQLDASQHAYLRDVFMPDKRKYVREVLERGVLRGELLPSIHYDVAGDLLCGFNWYHMLSGNLVDDGQVIESMVHMVLNGLRGAAVPMASK